MKITTKPFGTTRSGEAVVCVRMEHESGITAEVLSYGAILRAVWVPGKNGPVQVCKGYETLEEYQDGTCYLGAIVGRCAGRIAGGRFTLNGKEYQVTCNQGENHLHGGNQGFDRKVWNVELLPDGVQLTCQARDGEEGYPGALDVTVRYRFDQDGALNLELEGTAQADTILSLTHHGYWNLEGEESLSVGDHLFSTPARQFVGIRPDCIPTGKFIHTQNTPFDFARPTPLKERWDLEDFQLAAGSGFDHTFLVEGEGLRPVCCLESPVSGLSLKVNATLPGIHLYTGNFLEPVRRSGAALEAQFIPDAPNHPQFPSIYLPEGKLWKHKIQYCFACEG